MNSAVTAPIADALPSRLRDLTRSDMPFLPFA
jgi:hypothetical protein